MYLRLHSFRMSSETKQNLTILNLRSKPWLLLKLAESSSLSLIYYCNEYQFHLSNFTKSYAPPKCYHAVTYLKEMPLTSCLCLQLLDERGEDAGDRLSGAIRLLMISLNCAPWKKNNIIKGSQTFIQTQQLKCPGSLFFSCLGFQLCTSWNNHI